MRLTIAPRVICMLVAALLDGHAYLRPLLALIAPALPSWSQVDSSAARQSSHPLRGVLIYHLLVLDDFRTP